MHSDEAGPQPGCAHQYVALMSAEIGIQLWTSLYYALNSWFWAPPFKREPHASAANGKVGFFCEASEECVKGRFTPWTMKVDHGRWPFSMVWLDGPTPGLSFFKKKNSIYKVFGSLTKCTRNVDQGEWPCTKKVMNALIFIINAQTKAILENKIKKIKFDHYLGFTSLIFLFSLVFTLNLTSMLAMEHRRKRLVCS